MFDWSGRKSAITFDVGASGLRAVQIGRTARGLHLAESYHVPRDGAETDRPAGIEVAHLRRAIEQSAFSGLDVALVVSPPDVQFFPLRVPGPALEQADERIEAALKWEVAQQSRANADELELRYWRLPPAASAQSNVIAATMPAATAWQWCDAAEAEGLTLRRIDAAPCALVRAACIDRAPADTDLWAVLDLGRKQSTLTVVVGRTPVYIRAVSVGARDWVRQISKSFEIDELAAEQLLSAHDPTTEPRGCRAAAGEGDVFEARHVGAAVSSVLSDSLRTLADDVRRCLAYVLQNCADTVAREVVIAGSGAALAGLPEYLHRALEIPATRLERGGDAPHATAGRHGANLPITPETAAAVGAALLDLEAAP